MIVTGTAFNSSDIDAIVFDVIGTLVDEDETFAEVAHTVAREAGIADHTELRRHWVEHLDHAMAEVVEGTSPWRPHAELVSEAGRNAVAQLGGSLPHRLDTLLAGVDSSYEAWQDVAEGIRLLREHRLVTGFSNGGEGSLARLALINDLAWHAVASTAGARTFKPAAAAYQYAIDTLELEPPRTLFVAAHPWDLRAADAFGFRTAYVARPRAERPRPGDAFDLEVSDLVELASTLGPQPGHRGA
jgi:2-haloacid dehalogenase